jgi:feruloyl-CoA synthase
MHDLFAAPRITAEHRPDGTIVLRSAQELAAHEVTVLASLRRWAAADPGHPLAAERPPDGGPWRMLSYGQAAAAAEAAGQGLLELGLGPGRPLLVLSGNSADHLVLSLAAMTAGIPVAPVSAAYSLQSRDHARIRQIAALITPGAVFARDAAPFAAALAALDGIPVITGGPADARPAGGAVTLAELTARSPGPEVRAAYAAIEAGTMAKILFTSGSTGAPKGVLNTHGMLAANQQMIRQGWPFLAAERPVIVDWLPWSHTFGGNHNVNLVIASGGTLYIDGGRPAPGLFAQSLANLAEVGPTIHFNVPAGYAQLIPALETDPQFARQFFARLRLAFNAGAALPAALRQRLAAVALATTGRPVPVTTSWGLTETAPAVTAAYDAGDPASVGVPLPGAEVKLVPVPDGYEIRARGPNVTPGYFGRPDLTAAAFDEEGFYRTGDAVRLLASGDPRHGVAFRGRLAEDFKLLTGTFVHVGAVRTGLLSAIPLLADAVIAGEGRSCPGALAWLNAAEARAALVGNDGAAGGPVVTDPRLLARLAAALTAYRPDSGPAGRVDRLLIMSVPADLDRGEITDKGYLNQRQVLAQRAHLVELLYADPPGPGVIVRGVPREPGLA